MPDRLRVDNLLRKIADNIYFQPTESTKMKYPCIVYEHDATNTKFADNRPYSARKRYMITVIDKNPDSMIPEKLAELPLCSFDRHYTADNLNHFVYSLYF